MINRRILVALTLTLTLLLTGAGYCDKAPAAKHGKSSSSAGRHRQVPAPIPDTPAAPQRSFPGNVSITLWWEQSQAATVVLFDYGQGKLHRTGKRPGGHWDATVKPNQAIYVAVVPANPGEKGHIGFYVTNNANGNIICQDDNGDTGGNGGADCGGTVTI